MKKFIAVLILFIPNISFAQIVSNKWSEYDTYLLVANVIKWVVLGILLYSIVRLINNVISYFKLKTDALARLDKVNSSINNIITIIIMLPLIWVASLFADTSPCCVLPDRSTVPMQSFPF